MLTTALFTILSIAGAVSAQTGLANNHYESSLNMTVDPGTVQPPEIRAGWCNGQTNTCATLCDDSTNKNDCSISTLVWHCLCAANNSAPGLQYYTQTMPTFVCEELFSQCNEQNVGSQDGQSACDDNIRSLCATQDPPENAVAGGSGGDDSSSTTSASSMTTMAATSTPKPNSDDNASSTTSSGFAAPTLAPLGNSVAAVAALGMMAYLV